MSSTFSEYFYNVLETEFKEYFRKKFSPLLSSVTRLQVCSLINLECNPFCSFT